MNMDERIPTGVTVKLTTAHSRIRSEIGNFPSGPTKYTVVHRRPVAALIAPNASSKQSGKIVLPNSMCRFMQHSSIVKSESETSQSNKAQTSSALAKPKIDKSEDRKPTGLKRSLSADHLDIFQPMPAKRPFPVQIWFNNRKRGPRLPVATALWQDSPLHDTQAFVCTKLLEASQARRYLQLQSKPRKYLHLTGGAVVAVNNPPPPASRKATIALPAMTVKMLPVKPIAPVIESPKLMAKKSPTLPPPPPLISLRTPVSPTSVTTKPERPPTPQQEQPLELCKRRKHSGDSVSPPANKAASAPLSPLNLAVRPNVTNTANTTPMKRKVPLPLPFILSNGSLKGQSEPLDLASPSPTTALNKLTLTDIASPITPTNHPDVFRLRLLLVLQVLLSNKALQSLGYPQTSIDEVLVRYLKKAGVNPVASNDVRTNWIKFLRLCMKNDDAWKNEGWDRKSPDAILEEIYLQDVIPTLRKTDQLPISNKLLIMAENERNIT